ncbi:MAG TPA: ribosome biogenesis GTP-binding protein YihA/YsxC [Burkholderiales bacterium]
MKTFAQADFLAAAGRPEDLPPPGPPELAFAGRSNVGKSSAINALLARKRLAYTSKTPGRTQTINFYQLAGGQRLVDLPGYGFARVPQPMRAHWESLVGGYLGADRPLAGVVLVMDARHPLTPLDRQLLAWLGDARVLLLLTKADKLGRAEQAAALKTVASLSGRDARLFSSVSRQGVEDCRRLLEQWLAAAGANKKPPVKGM